MSKVLVTGAAGFIGAHVSRRLCEAGHEVLGVDNLSRYYSRRLKRDRLRWLADLPGFRFRRLDLRRQRATRNLCRGVDRVVHLAAQPGVRYSVEHPGEVVEHNVGAFVNVLESAVRHGVEHVVYASSSSVYGMTSMATADGPLRNTDAPMSVYAATKKADELIAAAFCHLYHLPVTGLRYHTVYGPWGRPDMAVWKFARQIAAGEPLTLYGRHGSRDFTYVDDAVDATLLALQSGRDKPNPHRLLDVGFGTSIPVPYVVYRLEQLLGRRVERRLAQPHPADVLRTCAALGEADGEWAYIPTVQIDEGLARFVEWFKPYHNYTPPRSKCPNQPK